MTKPISPLRQRMLDDMALRNMSPNTQNVYTQAVANYARHFGQSPDKLGIEDVRRYRLHLIERGLKATSINPIVGALRFFYSVTLDRKDIAEDIPFARKEDTLPAVMTPAEVVRLLEAVDSAKMRTALTAIYAAGLRVSEVVALTATDIDSQRMVIYIRQGKGGKDRYVMLSEQLLGILRRYYKRMRPKLYLFPSPDPAISLTTRSVLRLDAGEFMRRFLMHVLPDGFHRIRHYGLFANGHRAEKLALCRKLLQVPVDASVEHQDEGGGAEDIADPPPCPCCGGRMRIIETFERGAMPRSVIVVRFDTS